MNNCALTILKIQEYGLATDHKFFPLVCDQFYAQAILKQQEYE